MDPDVASPYTIDLSLLWLNLKYFDTKFWGDETGKNSPLSFRNDYIGLGQEVCRYDDSGRKRHVNVRLKQELTSFAKTWFQNLKNQGFLGDTAIRERLTWALPRSELYVAHSLWLAK